MTGRITAVLLGIVHQPWRTTAILSSILLVVSLGVFAPPPSDYLGPEPREERPSRPVVIEEGEARNFEEKFDPDEEVSWCLYGRANETHIVVEEVRFDDDTRDRRFGLYTSCPKGILETRTPFLGTVHSHPYGSPFPSKTDIHSFGDNEENLLMGVYTGEFLNLYTHARYDRVGLRESNPTGLLFLICMKTKTYR